MRNADVQAQCELGQEQLMRMEYLQAERTLAGAEAVAWAARDFDALARLYMPLQEARRQRRQRCGEGTIRLDLLAEGPGDRIDAAEIIEKFPHGQLLVAGWGSIEPAIELRRLQERRGLYVETFLGAVYPTEDGRVVAIVPLEDTKLPEMEEISMFDLAARLPQGGAVVRAHAFVQSSAVVMGLWERLHQRFLFAADAETDPLRKIEGYRQTIAVDYACELAHQKLSDVARELCKSGSKS